MTDHHARYRRTLFMTLATFSSHCPARPENVSKGLLPYIAGAVCAALHSMHNIQSRSLTTHTLHLQHAEIEHAQHKQKELRSLGDRVVPDLPGTATLSATLSVADQTARLGYEGTQPQTCTLLRRNLSSSKVCMGSAVSELYAMRPILVLH